MNASAPDRPGRLVAVLCNPPLRRAEQTTSWRNIEILTSVLGCGAFDLVNLVEQPTKSTVDLIHFAGALDLDDVECRIGLATRSAAVVAVGWGARAPTGWRRQPWRDLVAAAKNGLATAGYVRVAHVSDVPRHPSRWRQHTSPVHHRYVGSCFEERLAAALRWSEVHDL
jgi:hypothetical protein